MFRKLMNIQRCADLAILRAADGFAAGERSRRSVLRGNALDAKKDLAKRIVKDFHSAEEAERVAIRVGRTAAMSRRLDHTVRNGRAPESSAGAGEVCESVTEADKIVKSNGGVGETELRRRRNSDRRSGAQVGPGRLHHTGRQEIQARDRVVIDAR